MMCLVCVVLELWLRLGGIPAVGDMPARGSNCLQGLYETFREQAARYGIGAALLGGLALLAATLVAVVPPAAASESGSGGQSVLASLEAQPRIPLAALAGVLWLGMSHHVGVSNGARELAAAAMDSETAALRSADGRPAETATCAAIRAQWERKLGAASNGMVQALASYGPPSRSAEDGRKLADQARVVSASEARRVASLGKAAEEGAGEIALRDILNDGGRMATASELARLAVERAERDGASGDDVVRWVKDLEGADSIAEEARAHGIKLLADATEGPALSPATVPSERVEYVASEMKSAAGEVEKVAVEVEQFIRQGPKLAE